MSQIQRDLTSALEQHIKLLQAGNDVIDLGRLMATDPHSVAGNEAFADSMKELGNGLLSVTMWVGGKALTAFSSVIQTAGSALSKSFDDNKSYIKRLLGDVGKADDHTLKLSATQVGMITCKGDPDNISRDMDILIRNLEALDKHNKAVLDHLDAQLIAVRKLKDAKHTDDVFGVIDAVEKLKYPVLAASDVLPGGKEWTFTSGDADTPKYSMSGDTPAGEGGDLSLSKSSAAELLNKLDKVNSLHQRVKAAYDGYLAYIKSWTEMVKGVDENMTKLEYRVSKSALKEAEKLLEGNRGALAFYSGFTPRVVGYTDRYIHGVLGVFA
jgi:hypothetical protein